jgi:mono/diheme cytochrome c family protein
MRDMVRTAVTVGGFGFLAFLTACGGGPAPAPAPEPAAAEEVEAAVDDSEASTLDGVYTVAQAERGHKLFQAVCSECHDAADWTDSGFLARWADQSTYQLWYYINDRMPYDDPFSLTRQQVTDVMTYIFQLNGLPAGDSEMGTDDDSIDDYWIIWSD